MHRPPSHPQKKLLKTVDWQKLKHQDGQWETWKRTSIGIQMMHRTDRAHPALLWVLAKSRWVNPWKTHLPRQNIRLVSECVIEPGAVPPQENIREIESKSQDDDAPSNEQQPKLVSESDVVDLFASTEEL